MAISYYYKDNFPPPQKYNLSALGPPLQEPTFREPFAIIANKQHYTVTPKFEYELTGVVVSYNDADGFTNIWHHKRWKDFINVRDICVIWEPNVGSGIYRNIQFSSDSWTCWTSWKDHATSDKFHMTALSNNHLLTANNYIKSKLLDAEKGDVIRLKGVLAEYKNDATGTTRGTSITRTDSGNGACETVYIEDFKIIKKANAGWRILYTISKWLTLLSLIGFLILVGITPYKSRNF